jgi:hypothetical protein
LVDTVFEDVLVVVVVDDIDIPDGAEEDLLSEVADLLVAVVVVGVVAESDDDAFALEGTNGIEAGFNVDLIVLCVLALLVVVVDDDDVVDVRFGIGISLSLSNALVAAECLAA